jgi:hypothetical protein
VLKTLQAKCCLKHVVCKMSLPGKFGLAKNIAKPTLVQKAAGQTTDDKLNLASQLQNLFEISSG